METTKPNPFATNLTTTEELPKTNGGAFKGALKQTAIVDSPELIKEPIFHLHVQTIGRSNGRCALPAAAYRAGVLMTTSDGSKSWDYRRKSNVVYSEIIAPNGSPWFATERRMLWIEAAEAEHRKNSIEAREIEVAIPDQLNLINATALCKEFATEMVTKHQIVVDMNLHNDHHTDYNGNIKNVRGLHAHFMLTTRSISANGFEKKTRDFDDRSKGMVRYWRKRWEILVNKYLEDSGSSARVSCLSNKERGIDRKASIPLGPAQTALERKGVRTPAGEWNRKISVPVRKLGN